jgi:GNAT superfamily N-acetyltransferase
MDDPLDPLDPLDGLRIREMTPADCRPVSEIRIGGWRTAYVGMIPQPYLDRLDVDADTERRRGYLEKQAKGDGEVLNLVAERRGELVGWVCHGPYREGEVHTGDAELYALYVRPGHFSTGVGGALLQESARRCATAGHERMLLWVLKENARARRFYEGRGFSPDGAEEPFEVEGVLVPEVRYVRALQETSPA